MNRRLLIQVAAPAVLIGLLLFAACLVSTWYVNRLQTGMNDMLSKNVASLRAGKEMEISVRQLRLHCFAYLVDPDPTLLQTVYKDNERFQEWLALADQSALTATEQALVAAIKEGYNTYLHDFERMRGEVAETGPRRDFHKLADAGPLRPVIDCCRKYSALNDEMMTQTSRDNTELTRWLRWTMLLLGIGGPLGGLLSGYGIARGLSRSLYRLSVRVQDVAHQLDEDVAAVRLIPAGDLRDLDQQLDRVVERVAKVMERLQRQQWQMLRAQQLAALGQLAASVAHEVRNPLTAIKMLVEVGLRENPPRPVTREKLQVIHGEVLRLEQRVQNFLDFARPPALQRSAHDLRSLLEQALELVRARARQQTVQVQVRCPDVPVFALVDCEKLRTVIMNLLLNALDAMPRGGDLTVVLQQAPEAGIALTVADTGRGIAPEITEHLFEPFASTKPTGSGLGLSICKRVVEEHGGTITGANQSNAGACFTVCLPALAPEDTADGARSASEGEPEVARSASKGEL
jgi:signal transduction histidine kinase